MTKRLNSKHKVDRRLKVNLWGRPKSPFNTRAYPPGQHGQTKSSKPSDYGIQLQAKQKFSIVEISFFVAFCIFFDFLKLDLFFEIISEIACATITKLCERFNDLNKLLVGICKV